MSNGVEGFGPPEEEDIEDVIIEKIDQQKAQEAWAKLQKEVPHNDKNPTFRHDQHVFYCFRTSGNKMIKNPNFFISIFPPNSDTQEDCSLVDITLVREKNGFFTVIQEGVDIARQTSLTTQEVNFILDKIATSVKETKKEATETEGIVSQIRKKLER